ncbi:hypothetical protein [Natrinema sp. H-ect4]|uniref:hypothetical protein n=1 Tax=Natrinema sp. H-ect4 TaxID=3242699 RepID=UPI0035A93A57
MRRRDTGLESRTDADDAFDEARFRLAIDPSPSAEALIAARTDVIEPARAEDLEDE